MFINSPQNKNINIASFVLAVSLELDKKNEDCVLKILSFTFGSVLHHVLQKKESANGNPNIWKSKIGIDANITNFVLLWKLQMEMQVKETTPFEAAAKWQKKSWIKFSKDNKDYDLIVSDLCSLRKSCHNKSM